MSLLESPWPGLITGIVVNRWSKVVTLEFDDVREIVDRGMPDARAMDRAIYSAELSEAFHMPIRVRERQSA